MNAHNILLGCDPELFVTTKDGDFRSGHDLIPGTKTRPFDVAFGAIQVDGVALEFNTEPASSKEEFVHHIDAVMTQLEGIYKQKNPDLEITIEPTATFDLDYFMSLPEEARELGCQPDYNAYTEGMNDKPFTTEPFRTGSGHIHIGWGKFRSSSPEHFSVCCQMVRQLDAVLFLSSLLWDNDEKRRELYGKIGAFRPKTYGVEYRPMSNRWLSKKVIQEFVYEAAIKASNDFLSGVIYEEKWFVRETLKGIHQGEKLDEKEIRNYLRALNDEFGTPLFI